MRKILLRIPLFFLSALSIPSFSQNKSITKKDTLTVPADSSVFFSFKEESFDYGNYIGKQERLTNYLDDFQNYHARNSSLGNSGSPERSLNLLLDSEAGFQRGIDHTKNFGFNENNRKFYTSEKPYTKLQYILGQKQENNICVIHAHPLGKNCNVAFGFDRIRSTGSYKNQNTNNTSIDLNGWYRSPGRRYALLADVYWTADNYAQNGGLVSDSAFENKKELDNKLVPVYLTTANTEQRSREAWMKQYWAFGSIVDTISTNDSDHVATKILPSWAIVNTLSIKDQSFVFSDKDTLSGYFPAVYRDSAQTKDSTYMWKFTGGLWVERFNKKNNSGDKRIFSGKTGVRFESGEIFNDTIYKHFQNIFLDGQALFYFSRSEIIHAVLINGNYAINGYNSGDYYFHLAASTDKFNNNISFNSQVISSLKHPDFIYSHYSGNHYRWENDFSQTAFTRIELNAVQQQEATDNFFTAGVSWNNYFKPLYFDSLYFLPAQYSGSFSAFEIHGTILAGTKHIRSKTTLSFNNCNKNSPIHLPVLTARESFYVDVQIFHSALRLQAGVDAFYTSSFYGDAWNVGLSQFQLQNRTLIGNYVFLDPWLSFKVKPVRVFVKADHVNAGWFGRKYYLIEHYPQFDMMLKFGVSWVFND
ncbi:MAG: hypothetical protein HY064_17205 [Bacteroidetes bacterium]|nr:hypothetical protein [Bacteroidota bacterium]